MRCESPAPPDPAPGRAPTLARRDLLKLGVGGFVGVIGLADTRRAHAAETVISLGVAKVAALTGSATTQAAAARPPAGPSPAPAQAPSANPSWAPPRTLRVGDSIGSGEQVKTSTASQLELVFADGTLLRLGPASAVVLLPAARRVLLGAGRALVCADRMVGGLTVLTRDAALLPEGTTYLVELASGAGVSAVSVLEGAVCACPIEPSVAGAAARRPTPTRDRMVLPGESLPLRSGAGPEAPTARDLGALLKSEPLITGFQRPLPSLRVLVDLADQQRRRVLAARNDRLRREIFWKRPPRAPLKLPELLGGPTGVRFEYYFPQ